MVTCIVQPRDDFYRGGQMESTHRNGSSGMQHSSRSSHQFGPAVADCKQQSSLGRGGSLGTNQPRKHKRPGNMVPPERLHQQHQQHISFSSSEEELRSTSECTSCDEHESEKGKGFTIVIITFVDQSYY